MKLSAPAEFSYRLRGKSLHARPGAHHSNSRGAGMHFVSHARLLDQPDPRRLDLRASLCNIKQDWLVRINQQRSSLTVSAIVDTSASMHFGAKRSKLHVAADFIEALAYSTGTMGDAIGLLAFDQRQRSDLSRPPRFGRGLGPAMGQILRQCTPTSANTGASPSAFSDCVSIASNKTSMVFVVSDFHWPIDNIKNLLDPLANSNVIPMVVWDPAEIEPPEGSKLLSAHQLGGKTTRHLWMNDRVRQQWRHNVAQRRKEISQAFASSHSKPFFISGQFQAEELSRYFLETAH